MQARQMLIGSLWALSAVSIWALWILLTRLGVETSLTPVDIAVLRFGTAGLLLSPIVLRKGIGLAKAGPVNLAVMIIGAGAPYLMVANLGLAFAPAAHAAVLMPGVMPLWVALLSMIVLKERPSSIRRVGFACILAGVASIAAADVLHATGQQPIGHLLFLCAAFLWACFTIANRRAGLEPMHAASVICLSAALIMIPIFFLTGNTKLAEANFGDIALQIVFQGVISAIFSLYAYNRAIQMIGPARAATFGALVPVTVMLAGMPLLGEYPSAFDLAGVAAVSLGVFFATRS